MAARHTNLLVYKKSYSIDSYQKNNNLKIHKNINPGYSNLSLFTRLVKIV